MRHFLCYDENGNFTGTHGFTNAVTGARGWPEDFDIDNPDTANERARNWLDSYGDMPCGFVAFDCPCSPLEENCTCAQTKRCETYRSDDGTITDKPVVVAMVDGLVYDQTQALDRVPGSVSKLKFVSDVPDGTTHDLMQGTPAILVVSDLSVVQTFTGGETPEIDVIAPAQGFIGSVRAYGKFCRPITVNIRGWGV